MAIRVPHVRAISAFTLLELAVVMAVIGVLSGIAVLSFGDASTSSKSVAADTALDRVTAVEQSIAQQWGAYSAWPADLSPVGDGVEIVSSGPAESAGQVSVAVGTDGTLGLATPTSGACRYRRISPPADGGHISPVPSTTGSCDGAVALPSGTVAAVQDRTIADLSY